ncbi:MAG: CPBP family intramembrane metalloprotease [Oscillospiraceae bacterium]|jgi:membrane protease YdiL (CAAX protease family)|nr:CPBP family intramembrane metalloprotease [Oscillospiraceae bacterium]
MMKTYNNGLRYSTALGLTLLLYVLIDFALLLGYSVISIHIEPNVYLVSIVLAIVPCLLSFGIVFRREVFVRPVVKELFGFKPKDVFVWLAAMFSIIIIANIIGNAVYQQFYGVDIPVPPDTQDSLVSVQEFLYSIMLAPIVEEVTYRHLLYKPLKKVSTFLAIVVPAVLFAITHGNLFQVVYALPAGIFMGAARHKYGSLVFSVLIHALNNLSTIIISACARSENLILANVFTLVQLAIVVIGAVCLVVIIVNARKNKLQNDTPAPRVEAERVSVFGLSATLWIGGALLITACGFALLDGFGLVPFPRFQIAIAALCAVNAAFLVRGAVLKRRQSAELCAELCVELPAERPPKFKISPLLWLGIATTIVYTAYMYY